MRRGYVGPPCPVAFSTMGLTAAVVAAVVVAAAVVGFAVADAVVDGAVVDGAGVLAQAAADTAIASSNTTNSMLTLFIDLDIFVTSL